MSNYVLLLCAMVTLALYSVEARHAHPAHAHPGHDHDHPECCSCHNFTSAQEKQLTNLLKKEAVSLRKGMMGQKPPPSQWQSLTSPTGVSFRTKDDSPGTLTIPREGFVAAIKLVHVSGQVTCDASGSYNSHWGCATSNPDVGTTPLGTFITTPDKRVLFPHRCTLPWYALPGFQPDSQTLVIHDFSHPEYVQIGDTLQFWYGEDLKNVGEVNNKGETFFEVYAWYL